VREHGYNAGADVEKYQTFGGGRKGQAWCSWFVTWVLRQAGLLTPKFGRARDWFDKRHTVWAGGRQIAGRPPPQKGDLVGYTWGKPQIAHVGILLLWGVSPMAKTDEGNTSGGKQERDGEGVFVNWRLKSQISAVANVVDDPSYTTPKPVPK